MADGREAELRSRDLRLAVAAVRLGQDRPEIVRAAFFALQARLLRVRAMGTGMDGFTVGSEESAHDISPSVFVVSVDVDPVDGKHVADDQQEGRQRREKTDTVLLRTHFHKYSDSPRITYRLFTLLSPVIAGVSGSGRSGRGLCRTGYFRHSQ